MAATALQSQLQHLAVAAGITTNKPRGKPSLLYTFQEAADIGLQDIFDVAVQGAQAPVGLCWPSLRLKYLDAVLRAQFAPHRRRRRPRRR
jgi:hypothetical protein